jgi:hypothetical protein
LIILHKTLAGEAAAIGCDDENNGCDDENPNEGDVAQFVGKLIVVFDRMEQELDRMDSWFQSGTRLLRRLSLFGGSS